MKLLHTLPALAIIALVNVSCSRTTTDIQKKSDDVAVEQNDKPEKFKLTKNMVNINPVEGKYTVKVGQQLVYSADVHGSVGKSTLVKSSDESELPLSDTVLEYKNKQVEGMVGADAATAYFIFDVKKAGTYEIAIENHFQGALESKYSIEITVE